MAKHERNRGARVYHAFVAILLMLGGLGFIGTGVWLTSTNHQGILDLQYSGGNILFRYLLNLNVISYIIGAFLLGSGVISLIALARVCVGVTFRVIYTILALTIFATLFAVCTFSSVVLVHKENSDIRMYVRDAWTETQTSSPIVLCAIEAKLQCRGFETGDCDQCATGFETTCGPVRSFCAQCNIASPHTEQGCYYRILDVLNDVFLPSAIVSGILGVIMLADIFCICFL